MKNKLVLSEKQQTALIEYLLSEYDANGVECWYVFESDALFTMIDEDNNDLKVMVEDEGKVFVYINDVLQEDVFNIDRLETDRSPRESEVNVPVIDVGEI